MSCAEWFCAYNADLGRMKLGVEEVLHGASVVVEQQAMEGEGGGEEFDILDYTMVV